MDYYDDDNSTEETSQPSSDNRNQGDTSHSLQQKPAKQPNNMAAVSLVCGIIGILALCFCIAFPVSIISGVAAIVLALQSKQKQPFDGMAIAGLILGIFSLVLGIAECLYLIFINFMLRDPEIAALLDQFLEQYGGFPSP